MSEESSDATVTRIFSEYCAARERDPSVSPEEFVKRVPPDRADDLRRRISVVEMLDGMEENLDAPSPELPASLGRFEIRRSLGSGGLSQVFLAFDPSLGREVALKVLDRGLIPDQRERAWILNEARSLALLEHPGVVRVLEVGSAEGFDFVALEHLSGPTLAEVLLELGRLGDEAPPPDAPQVKRLAHSLVPFSARTALFQRIAEALAYCHVRGVIHRDVKPNNVVFSQDGIPKLIDFGLAHLEDAQDDARPMITQNLVGAAAYIAPEQVEANQTGADPRSDQFSLAILFYESLALVNPFEAPTTLQTTQAVLRCELTDLRRRVPGVPAELALIVHRALERDPDRRYPTVQKLADDLLALLEHRPLSIGSPSVVRRLGLWTRRHWVPVSVTAALVVVGGGTLIGSWANQVLEEYRSIDSELSEIEKGDQSDAEDFWQTGMSLISLKGRVPAFDARVGRELLSAPQGERLERVRSDWSERLAVAFADPDRTYSSRWFSLFDVEEAACPSCTANLEERGRGKIIYPMQQIGDRHWELLQSVRFEDDPDFEYLVPIKPSSELRPGFYRLQVWEADGACAYDHCFVVRRERERERTLRLHAADRPLLGEPYNPLLEQSIFVPERAYPVLSSGTEELPVEACLLLPRPITPQELDAFRETETFRRHLVRSERSQAISRVGPSMAWVDIELAAAFAAWAGGRLPSIEELTSAADQGLIEVEPIPRMQEWVRNLNTRGVADSGAYFVHSRYARGDPAAPALKGSTPNREGQSRTGDTYTSFRVVFTPR